MVRLIQILIVCGILTSCVTSQSAGQSAGDIHEASERFWKARSAGDASALEAQLTETAILMVPGLPDTVGRAAVRDMLQKRAASLRVTDFTVHRRETQVIGDAAHELGWYSEIHNAQGDALRMEGRYLLVWQRGQDGVWRVHRNLFNFSDAIPVE